MPYSQTWRPSRRSLFGLALLTVVVLTWLAVDATGVHADAYPGRNGRILFTSERSGDQEVWSMNPDGSDPQNLSNSPNTRDRGGSWSPTGKQITFVRSGGAGGTDDEIWVMNADGSDQRQLTDNTSDDNHASWSPDGSQLAFTRNTDDIWVMNADGTNQRNLTNDAQADYGPNWSPDGSKIAFISQRGANTLEDIYTMNPDGSDVQRVTREDETELGPSWSPDGRRIAFFSDVEPGASYDIYSINRDGSDVQRLTTTGDNEFGPGWSPDGSSIAYTRANKVWVMNADGTNQRAITTGGADDFSPDWQPLSDVRSAASVPACSRTGQIGVTVSDPSGFVSPPEAVRFRVDGGGEQRQLTSGSPATTTIQLFTGRHSLEYWGENRVGDQQSPHNTASVLVDRQRPRVTIRSLQGRTVYRVGQRASVRVRASDRGPSGLARNPSRRSLRISTRRRGRFTVRRTAVDRCGNRLTARFTYRVRAAQRRVSPRLTG